MPHRRVEAPGAEPRREAFWAHGGVVVRQSSVAGLHGFGACTIDRLDAEIADALGEAIPCEGLVELRRRHAADRIEGESHTLAVTTDGSVLLDEEDPVDPATACARLAALLHAD